MSLREKIIELLNSAKLSNRDDKYTSLSQAFDVAFNREPRLLREFAIDFLSFEIDPSTLVRKTVVSFIDALLHNFIFEYSGICIEALIRLIDDSSPTVAKKAISVLSNNWRKLLELFSSNTNNPPVNPSQQMKKLWDDILLLKFKAITKLDNENESIKMQAIKFTEIFLVSTLPPSPDDPLPLPEIMSINPSQYPFVDIQFLRTESEHILNDLLERMQKCNTSTSLMMIMTITASLCKSRAFALSYAVPAMINLYNSPPKSLPSALQLSVKRTLRTVLIQISKAKQSIIVQQNFSLLTDIINALSVACNISNLEETPTPTPPPPPPPIPSQLQQENIRRARSPMENMIPFGQPQQKRIRSDELIQQPLPIQQQTQLPPNEIQYQNFPPPQTTTISITTPPPPPTIPMYQQQIPAQIQQQPLMGIQVPKSSMHELEFFIPGILRLELANVVDLGIGSLLNTLPVIPVALPHLLFGKEMTDNLTMLLRLLRVSTPAPNIPTVTTIINPTNLSTTQQIAAAVATETKTETTAQPIEQTQEKELTQEERGKIRDSIIKRLILSEKVANCVGAKSVREELLARMSTLLGGDKDGGILEYAFSEAASGSLNRQGLALRIAFHSAKETFQEAITETEYESFLNDILRKVQDPSPVLLKSPWVPNSSISMLDIWARQGKQSSVNALRDLVMSRQSCKGICLNHLLNYAGATEENEQENQLRELSTRILTRQLFTIDESVEQEITTFAMSLIDPVLNSPPSSMPENEIKKRLRFPIAVCSLSEQAFSLLIDKYAHGNEVLKKCIESQSNTIVKEVISSKATGKSVLIRAISSPPQANGIENLLIALLTSITEIESKNDLVIINAAKELYKNSNDPRSLLPVISSLNREEILSNLHKFVLSLPQQTLKVLFQRIPSSAVNSRELLFYLHTLNKTSTSTGGITIDVPIKKAAEAVLICLDARASEYSQESLAAVLQQLAELSPLPVLLMRTVLLALQKHPNVATWLSTTLLPSLLRRQIWQDPLLWDGFVRCCKLLKDAGSGVLAQVPPQQLAVLVSKDQLLHKLLSAWCKQQKTQPSQTFIKVLENPSEFIPASAMQSQSPPTTSTTPTSPPS